jgi:LysM repeat protein
MRRRIIVLVSVVLASLLVTSSVAAAPATSSSSALAVLSAPGYHVVRPGETLFSIGRLYGVSPWAIASANHLANANKIYIGQCLYIPPRSVCYYSWCGCRYYYCCGYYYRCWR